MIKPLELVVSAIHCLGEKRGSSAEKILRYLEERYETKSGALKYHVQAGLKRGLNFGLLLENSGLFRLNDILNAPLEISKSEESQHKKSKKSNSELKKKGIHLAKRRKRIPVRNAHYKGRKRIWKNNKRKKRTDELRRRRTVLKKSRRRKQKPLSRKKEEPGEAVPEAVGSPEQNQNKAQTPPVFGKTPVQFTD